MLNVNVCICATYIYLSIWVKENSFVINGVTSMNIPLRNVYRLPFLSSFPPPIPSTYLHHMLALTHTIYISMNDKLHVYNMEHL